MALLKHSISFSVATFLSRVFGYIRDALIAYYFGVSHITDAFFIAFRLPNTLRRILGEGGFNASFVPIFAQRLKEGTHKSFEDSVFTYYTLLNLLITLMGVFFAEYIIRLIAPGVVSKDYFELTVFMARFLFLYLFFVGLSAFFMAVLNTRGVFFVPAFAQAVFNIVMSACLVLLSEAYGYYALIVGVLVGGLAQLFFHFPSLISKALLPRITWHMDKDLAILVKRLLPALFGFGVAQLSFFIDTFLASLLAVGSVSYLYYANRIFQLPLGALSVGVANSLLAVLSTEGKHKENITTAFRFVSLLSLPASVGLVLLSEPIVGLLYGRGRFLQEDIHLTAKVLSFYSLGLVFFSLQKALSSVFFSKGDTKSPVLASLVGILAEALLAYTFAFVLKLGVAGLALGTASSSLFALGFLLVRWKERQIDLKAYKKSLVKGGVACLVMSLLLLFLEPSAYELIYAIPLGAFVYWSVLLLLREPLAYLPLSLLKSLVQKGGKP